jgi:hypothetical protein
MTKNGSKRKIQEVKKKEKKTTPLYLKEVCKGRKKL